MTGSSALLQSELLPEALDISFKLVPSILVIGMLGLFLTIGYVFRVADTDTDNMGRGPVHRERRERDGDRRQLDVGGVLSRDGRVHRAGRLLRTGVRCRLDDRILHPAHLPRRAAAPVREVHGAGLRRRSIQLRHRAPLRR